MYWMYWNVLKSEIPIDFYIGTLEQILRISSQIAQLTELPKADSASTFVKRLSYISDTHRSGGSEVELAVEARDLSRLA